MSFEAVPATDAELVAAVANGDRSALEAIYREHGSSLYGLAGRTCEPALASEIVVAVFVELWRDPPCIEGDGEDLARCLRVATRREAIRRQRDQRSQPLPLQVVGPPGSGSEAFDVLTDEERVVIVPAYFGGHRCAELAARLGLPQATVVRRMGSGLRRLAEAAPESPDRGSPSWVGGRRPEGEGSGVGDVDAR